MFAKKTKEKKFGQNFCQKKFEGTCPGPDFALCLTKKTGFEGWQNFMGQEAQQGPR
jgi:hypothetical protein